MNFEPHHGFGNIEEVHSVRSCKDQNGGHVIIHASDRISLPEHLACLKGTTSNQNNTSFHSCCMHLTIFFSTPSMSDHYGALSSQAKCSYCASIKFIFTLTSNTNWLYIEILFVILCCACYRDDVVEAFALHNICPPKQQIDTSQTPLYNTTRSKCLEVHKDCCSLKSSRACRRRSTKRLKSEK